MIRIKAPSRAQPPRPRPFPPVGRRQEPDPGSETLLFFFPPFLSRSLSPPPPPRDPPPAPPAPPAPLGPAPTPPYMTLHREHRLLE